MPQRHHLLDSIPSLLEAAGSMSNVSIIIPMMRGSELIPGLTADHGQYTKNAVNREMGWQQALRTEKGGLTGVLSYFRTSSEFIICRIILLVVTRL